MNNDVNAVINGAFALGLDIAKGYKAKKGASGYIDAIAADPVVLASFKTLIENITKLPSDVTSLQLSDYLSMIPQVVSGVEAIITEAKA